MPLSRTWSAEPQLEETWPKRLPPVHVETSRYQFTAQASCAELMEGLFLGALCDTRHYRSLQDNLEPATI
jgi:hypothetical protein